VIRGTLREAGPDHVTIDRGGPKGPLYDPLVRIERDRIVSFAEPEAAGSARPRWVHLGFGASSLGGQAFRLAFETTRDDRSDWLFVALLAGNGQPAPGERPLLGPFSDEGAVSLSRREVAVSAGPALGWRTGGGRAALGWWLGATAVGGELADGRGFLTGGLLLGTELLFAPSRAIGIGIQHETNLNPEVPFSAAFLTLRFHSGT
jgi:hypothetical protein